MLDNTVPGTVEIELSEVSDQEQPLVGDSYSPTSKLLIIILKL